ncbi:MAG: winged helix-turn-helix transcriptional regulator [Candidatus Krumholzibacteria bacterium]|nr:winged helix-turn-helix transcriptional regulator [Candidatus Krumholzibacteria bacterium]
MKNVLSVTKALSDGNRLRTVMALHEMFELCVCQVTEMLGLAPATVSRHMSILQNAGLVSSRKNGRWVYYRLSEMAKTEPIVTVMDWLGESLDHSKEIKADRKYLRKIARCGAAQYCSNGSCEEG